MPEEVSLEFERLVLKCANGEESIDLLVKFAKDKKIPIGPSLDRLKIKEIPGGPASIVFTRLTMLAVKRINN